MLILLIILAVASLAGFFVMRSKGKATARK